MDFVDSLAPFYDGFLILGPMGDQAPTFFLSVFLLVMARLLPILALSPFLGSKTLPRPVKMAFAVSLFALFWPYVIESMTVKLTYNLQLVFLLVKELFIGAVIGFFASVPFYIAEAAGTFIDNQRGAASLQVSDPIIQNQASPIGVYFNLYSVYLYWLVGGPLIFLEAVFESYRILPIDQFINPAYLVPSAPFWHQILFLYNTFMKLAIQLATPALIIILMTDTFLGIANRLAPQVQMTFLGMPLKAFFGVFIIFIGWHTFINSLADRSILWMEQVPQLFNFLAFGG